VHHDVTPISSLTTRTKPLLILILILIMPDIEYIHTRLLAMPMTSNVTRLSFAVLCGTCARADVCACRLSLKCICDLSRRSRRGSCE